MASAAQTGQRCFYCREPYQFPQMFFLRNDKFLRTTASFILSQKKHTANRLSLKYFPGLSGGWFVRMSIKNRL